MTPEKKAQIIKECNAKKCLNCDRDEPVLINGLCPNCQYFKREIGDNEP